jgi:hypothetical protein
MGYIRIIPRDFFNEAKLLKCLGQLELIINHIGPNKIGLVSEHDGEAFDIKQDSNDGSLYVSNYHVFLDGEEIRLFTSYNSKESYPLYGEYKGEIYCMFNEEGKLLPNFGK